MFTGLVEAIGNVVSLVTLGDQARLTLEIPFVGELALGDSVAINGCCLTVAQLADGRASFDLLLQTLRVTSLGTLESGDWVNLERAILTGSRFGGHFVQGHVDATGTILALRTEGQDHVVTVALPPEIERFCLPKGSITIDGISLTIAELNGTEATFWITPHTWEYTNLQHAKVGQWVNLEADMLAKYVEKLMAKRESN